VRGRPNARSQRKPLEIILTSDIPIQPSSRAQGADTLCARIGSILDALVRSFLKSLRRTCQATMDWKSLFETCVLVPGATQEQIELCEASVFAPLTRAECAELVAVQQNPFRPTDSLHAHWKPVDPEKWQLPTGRLPPSFLDLLRWSDGPNCLVGKREFQFFGTASLREMLLAYQVPEYMPGSVPFAFNGGGIFTLFDMRQPPIAGEYPILVASSGNLDYVDAVKIAESFPEVCQQRWNVEDVLYP